MTGWESKFFNLIEELDLPSKCNTFFLTQPLKIRKKGEFMSLQLKFTVSFLIFNGLSGKMDDD